MNIQIRPANVADLPALLKLQKLAFRSEAALYPETEIPPMRQTLPELEREFSQYTTLCAEQGGEPVEVEVEAQAEPVDPAHPLGPSDGVGPLQNAQYELGRCGRPR